MNDFFNLMNNDIIRTILIIIVTLIIAKWLIFFTLIFRIDKLLKNSNKYIELKINQLENESNSPPPYR